MALQFSVEARNRRLDSIEVEAGTAPILSLRSGAPPANCATANSGTVISTITLPVDWLGAAASGQKSISGSWVDTSADNPGTVAHFRIHTSDGANCVIQGTCSNTGDGGDMTLDNNVVAAGQNITVATFTITDGNA